MKILVIRFSSAGDVILTSPFVRALRARFRSAEVHYITKAEYEPLLRHSPHVDRIISFPTDGRFRDLFRLKSQLIAETGGAYDLVFDLHDSLRSRYLRAGLGRGTGVMRKPALAKWLLVHRKIDRLRPITPIPLRYLQVGRAFGIEDDGDGLELHIGETPSPILPIPARRTVGIAPGARHFTKQWPAERFAGVARELAASGVRIVLFGRNEERGLCADIARQVDGAVNLAGRIDLLQAAAAADVCDVIITNDSAMSHVAAARRRPVVAIFGSTVQQFGFSPFRTRSIVVENPGLYCRPCTSIGRDACPEGHFRCMREIAMRDVVDAAGAVAA